MPLIFITGAPGSGKSTVLQQLENLGHIAYGSDEHGLSHRIHRPTGEFIIPPDKFDVHEWYKQHEWKISRNEVQKLKKRTEAEGSTIFLCGVGDGIDDVWEYFDQVIVLIADEPVLRRRISKRENNDFGKTAEELNIVLGWQDKHVPAYKDRGATAYDNVYAQRSYRRPFKSFDRRPYNYAALLG